MLKCTKQSTSPACLRMCRPACQLEPPRSCSPFPVQEHATSAAVAKTNFRGAISSVFVPYLRWGMHCWRAAAGRQEGPQQAVPAWCARCTRSLLLVQAPCALATHPSSCLLPCPLQRVLGPGGARPPVRPGPPDARGDLAAAVGRPAGAFGQPGWHWNTSGRLCQGRKRALVQGLARCCLSHRTARLTWQTLLLTWRCAGAQEQQRAGGGAQGGDARLRGARDARGGAAGPRRRLPGGWGQGSYGLGGQGAV